MKTRQIAHCDQNRNLNLIAPKTATQHTARLLQHRHTQRYIFKVSFLSILYISEVTPFLNVIRLSDCKVFGGSIDFYAQK